MSDNNEVEELEPCELGTQEHWNKVYSEEFTNFTDFGDVGEVWFGEDSALRVVSWMTETDLVDQEDAIIDLGCGNGMMLIELAREGFTNLTGVDYSESAITLAQAVVVKTHDFTIDFEVCDILSDKLSITKKFNIALDKGTYDAISLNPEGPKEKRLRYIQNVCDLLEAKGLLIITSCNWTQPELLMHFKNDFELVHVIPTPTFQFGGKIGSLVTSLVLRKLM